MVHSLSEQLLVLVLREHDYLQERLENIQILVTFP